MRVISSMILGLALTLGGVAAAPRVADACGGYRLDPLDAAISELTRGDRGTHVGATRTLDDGRVEVELRWPARGGKEAVQLVWLRAEQGAWVEDGRSYAVLVAEGAAYPVSSAEAQASAPAAARARRAALTKKRARATRAAARR